MKMTAVLEVAGGMGGWEGGWMNMGGRGSGWGLPLAFLDLGDGCFGLVGGGEGEGEGEGEGRLVVVVVVVGGAIHLSSSSSSSSSMLL